MTEPKTAQRLKRHRVKRMADYQTWQVWTIGTDRHLLACYGAKRSLFRQWFALYGEHLTTLQMLYLSVVRCYCASNGLDFFSRAKAINWAIDSGYLTKGHKHPKTFNPVFASLEVLQFINPLSNRAKYVLTNRAKLLFSYYEQHLKAFFAIPDQK